MQAELATWRPLWDFATMLFVLGIASGLNSRDRASWWISQGLLLLSVLIGFAAAQVTHAGVDLSSLGIWIAVAWGLTAFGSHRRRVIDQ
jgi:NADH:ubiquinone oxidoreductase subunit K